MSTTDDRIVSMQFDNADFERRLSATLASLDKLNQSIANTGNKNSLDEVNKSVGGFDATPMLGALDAIRNRFSTMGVIGASAIQKLTSGFMGFAAQAMSTAKADVLGPILTGGKQRAVDLQQAKFQFEGLGMNVKAGMDSALAAVKGTAYGLNDAAMVAAQFGASGIKAGDQMTRALTGISGIAAMTGRSYGEIGQIFTSMAGQGKVSSMDLMEFGIRGVNAAAAYGKETHQTEAQVRALVSAGKVGFPQFADAMDKAFGKHATDANQTYSGSLSNLHAALSRMGASFFSDRLVQERDLFNALTPVIDKFTKALGPLTTEILKVSGSVTNSLVKSFGKVNLKPYSSDITIFVHDIAAFANMVRVYLEIVKKAFGAIFPTSLKDDLHAIAGLFDIIISHLTPTGPAVAQVTHIFEALFAVFSILRNVVRGVFDVLVSFIDSFTGSKPHAVLGFLDSIATAVIKLQNYLIFQGKMADFFAKLSDAARAPAAFITRLVEDIKSLFTTTENSSAAKASLDKINAGVQGVATAADKVRGAVHTLVGYLDNAWSHISVWLSQLGQTISNTFHPNMFQGAVSALNVGLLGGVALAIRNFLTKGFKVDIGGGAFGQVKSGLTQFNKTLVDMQAELKAKVLLEIAGAIAVLTASILVLSMVKPDALQRAMVAMAVGFGQLVIVMKALDQIGGGLTGGAKLSMLSGAMVAMAAATLTLAGAVKVLAAIDPNALSRGLGAVTVTLTLLVGALKLLSENETGMFGASLAMKAMATGIVIMAAAVRIFSTMSWDQLLHGLAGLAGTLLIVVGAMNLMPIGQTLAAGAAMIPLATGITILAGALKIFGTMSWDQLLRGLAGLAGGLLIIAAAMQIMPLDMPITAAGLILVGIALNEMVPALKMMGNMSWDQLLHGLAGLAGMLLIVAVATNAMTGAIVGAAALLIVSNALLVLSGVLKILGGMGWTTIAMGLGALAATLAVLGIAAGLLQPLIPALLGLGAALTLVGVAFLLFGGGAFLVATAFSMMAISGAAGTAAIIASLIMLAKALPDILGQFVSSIEQMGTTLLSAVSALLPIVNKVLTQILALVVQQAPHIAAALVAIITSALSLIRAKFPDVVQTAFDLLITFLKALNDNIPKVVTEAVNIISNFASTLAKNADKLVNAAFSLITAFIAAIAKKAGDIAGAGLTILTGLLSGIVNHISKVVDAVGSIVANFITALGKNAQKIIDAGANVIVHFITGIGNDAGKIAKAAVDTIVKFLNGLTSDERVFFYGVGNAILTFLNNLKLAIQIYEPQIITAAVQIGWAIVQGLVKGIVDNGWAVIKAIEDMAGGVMGKFLHLIGAASPSKEFMKMGGYIVDGLAIGLSDTSTTTPAVVAHAESIVKAFSESLSRIPDALQGMDELNPVITPVLDLSKVRNTAAGLGALLSTTPITPAVSFAQASTIATTEQIAKNDQPPPPPSETTLHFEQTINAPTALSTNDIYRNTKSQIVMAKEELSIP